MSPLPEEGAAAIRRDLHGAASGGTPLTYIDPERFNPARKVVLGLRGMVCVECRDLIQRALGSQQGVISAAVDLVLRRAYVAFDPDRIRIEELVEAVAEAGAQEGMPFAAALLS